MDIKIVTRSFGNETSWAFGSCKSNQSYDDNKEYHELCCQPPKQYTLDCVGVDGWNTGYIRVGHEGYCGDFEAGEHQLQSAVMIGKFTHVNKYSNVPRLCVA